MLGTSVRRGRSVLGLMVASTPETSKDDLCRRCHVAPRALGSATACETCREIRREGDRRLREYRRREHLCMTCGAQAVPERSLCQRHLDYFAERQRTGGSAQRAETRESRRADGWCTMDGCANRGTHPGAPYCAEHLAWYREYHRTHKPKEK